jgi:hypothetical protein
MHHQLKRKLRFQVKSRCIISWSAKVPGQGAPEAEVPAILAPDDGVDTTLSLVPPAQRLM